MADLLWMPDILSSAGLQVREIPGWQTRSHGAMADVLGVLCHHTAGAATGDFPSERVVVNGRTGLAGPLCNLGLTRAGVWVIVAAGQGWHAGTGSVPWCPSNGNSHLIGVEAESVGTRDDWTPAQRSSYPRGVAALLDHLHLSASRAIGHKEWAPTRKIDPAFWDMNVFRAAVSRAMNAPSPVPRPTVEDDMPTPAELWQHPIPDEYTAKGGDSLPAFAALGFALARATFALEQIQAVAGALTRLETKLDRLGATTPTGSGPTTGLSDADVDRIVTALVKRSRAPLA